MERTLIILKPDAIQRGLMGKIITRFEEKGLQVVGAKLILISEELAAQHYAPHKGKPFYEARCWCWRCRAKALSIYPAR